MSLDGAVSCGVGAGILSQARIDKPQTIWSDQSHIMAAVDASRRNRKPRPLTDLEKEKLEQFADSIYYSPR